MYDPSKCGKLSMAKKRELVYAIAKCSDGAPEMLQSWSRRELLEILCAEMGKERKYTGVTKFKMIEHLLKIVSTKKSSKQVDVTDPETEPSRANNQNAPKRRRKTGNPSRLPIGINHFLISNGNEEMEKSIFCKNSACKATLHKEDTFCKRCSCCICYQYDENKDPSLWLVCSSEPPYQGNSCGLSCHLECALKHERAGIGKDGDPARLDGGFYCISCGKVNDLLGCSRKQLTKAKDTRRVDILCYRVSLSQKILSQTEKYHKVHEIVDTAAKKLEDEVGPLPDLPVNMARGIVNRLSSGPEVQKLCASAIESLDMILSSMVFHPPHSLKFPESHLISPIFIRFKDIYSTSLTVILSTQEPSLEEDVLYSLWHCKADCIEYPVEPTCTFLKPNTQFSVSDLSPATEYIFKVVSFFDERELEMREVRVTTSNVGNDDSKRIIGEGSQSPLTNSSSVFNPSVSDESNNIADHNNNPPGNYPKRLLEEIPGDSASALELGLRDVPHVPNSLIQAEHQRDSANESPVLDTLNPVSKRSPKGQLLEDKNANNGSKSKDWEVVLFESGFNAVLPTTPCKLENGKDGTNRSKQQEPSIEEYDDTSGKAKEPQTENLSKKKNGIRWDDGCSKDGSLEREYEYCVKVVRRLECEGHIEKFFRVKFLTWYSLRATMQERRIVKVFVDTLNNDPACLAGQLIDTFSEVISSMRPLTVPRGFCMKLWH